MSENYQGVLGTIRLMLDTRKERALLEHESYRGDRLVQMASNEIVENAARRVLPETDGFIPIGVGTDNPRELDTVSASVLRNQARSAEYRSELLGGYLRTMKRFVVGVGPTFTPDVSDELKERMSAWWKDFRELNRWDQIEDEIPLRGWRDGEVFQRLFVQKADGQVPFTLSGEARTQLGKLGVAKSDLNSRAVKKGMTMIRFVDPANVADPSGTFDEGIVTAEDDTQTVIGFIVISKGKEQSGEFVSAADMTHVKLNVDSDVLRGRSSLEPLLKRAAQYEDWVHGRLLLGLARSAIVLHKTVSGTAAQGQALSDANASQREDGSNDRLSRMYRAGTTITTNDKVSLKMHSPNLGAEDAASDGRMLQLTMVAAIGLPEGMFTGDWSNQNMASALVAQGPAYREFESQQDFWTPHYRHTYRSVMMNAAKADAIKGLTEEIAEAMVIAIDWPDIDVQDEKGHAEANAIRRANGVMSRETWIKDQGLDFAIETGRLANDREEDIEFGAMFVDPVEPDDGDGE